MKKLSVTILCLFLCAFSVSAQAQTERFARINSVIGTVEVKFGQAQWTDAQSGMKLFAKDEIRTAKDGYAEVYLDEGGETGKLDINPNTRMRINVLGVNDQTGDKITLIDVAIGQVMVYVDDLEGESRFEVRTPTSTMAVRGTVFEVVVAENKSEGNVIEE